MNKKNCLLVLIFFTLVSCSGLQSYYSKLEKCMTGNNTEQAQGLIASSQKSYGQKNEILYYFDLGFANHLAKNYKESNTAFEEAKKIYDANFTKSISAGAFSLFSNDNVIPYYGNTYEIAYMNVFCALNYILQGQPNEAVVEARQVDNLLKKRNVDGKGKAFFSDDPFIRYFMGIVYENAGYYNDALISYKLALKNYNSKNNVYSLPAPQDLTSSLYNLYKKLGFSNDANELKQKYTVKQLVKPDNCGELIIVNYNGLSPKKADEIIEMSFYRAWPYFASYKVATNEQEQAEKVRAAVRAGFSDDYIKIAFPTYVRYKNKVSSFAVEEVNIDKNKTSKYASYEVSDIGSLMIAALQRDNAAIHSKTIARAVGRFVLAKVVTNQIRKQGSRQNNDLSILANAILNVTNSLLEKADKRSWRTLPEEINMCRMYLSEGIHTLNIKYLSSSNSVIYQEQIVVQIEKDKKTFVLTKSFRS
ncbi:MAG: hypothetical protein II669_00930 [Elusimicrobia bacterium]|nr:hypothetical protein [Elusimicrobiota bacterium]